jgi:hypothetical protein
MTATSMQEALRSGNVSNTEVLPTGGTTARTLADLFADIINVKTYGAKGDGSTDDTAAIQAAFDAIPTAGATVYFPPGTYNVTAQLTLTDKPIHLFGDGMFISNIKWLSSATSDGILLTQTDDDYTVTVEGLTLLSEKAAVGTALKIDMSGQVNGGGILDRTQPRVVIRDLAIEGATSESTDAFSVGLHCIDVIHLVIDSFHFTGKKGGSAGTVDSSEAILLVTTTNAVEVFISNVWAFWASVGLSISEYEGVVLQNYNFVVVTKGVLFSSSGFKPQISVLNGHVNAFDTCIDITKATESRITGNLFFLQASAPANGVGVKLTDCKYYEVSANVFSNGSGVNFDTIVLAGTTNNCHIGPNVFRSATTAVWLQGNSLNNVVDRQVFDSVTTKVLDSGTDNITDQSSREIIRKASAETVNNSTTLINDADLKVRLDANETVSALASIRYSSGATPDIKFTFTVPAGASIMWSGTNGGRWNTSGTWVAMDHIISSGTTLALFGSGGQRWVHFWVDVINGATPGNLQLQWAQQTADASDTKVYDRSTLMVWRLP